MTRATPIVIACVLFLAAGFLLIALISYSSGQIQGQYLPANNSMGPAGAYLAHGLITLWGAAALLVPVIAAGWGYALLRDNDLTDPWRRLVGAILVVPAVAGLLHLLPPPGWAIDQLVRWDQYQIGGLGGATGYKLCGSAIRAVPVLGDAGILSRSFGSGGAAAVLLGVALLSVWLMELGLGAFLRRLARELRGRATGPTPRISTAPYVPREPAPGAKARQTTTINAIAQRMDRMDKQVVPVPTDVSDLVNRIRAHLHDPAAAPSPIIEDEATKESQQLIALVIDDPAAPRPTTGIRSQTDVPDAHEAPARATVAVSAIRTEARAAAGLPATSTAAPAAIAPAEKPKPVRSASRSHTPGGEYILPPVSLLGAAPARKDAEHEAEKSAVAKLIEETFAAFDIQVQVVGATRGPVVTQYEMRLVDQGMRVNKVEGFEKDLSLRLGTEGIRIVAPLPNRTTIGVEVPNKVKEAVVMRSLVEDIDSAAMALPVVIGRDAIGRPLLLDLAKAPHLLVAGATGMGKSVCMNAMICSILLFREPEDVRFIMIDPKMVELAGYEDIPHLLCPPITDMTKAHAALEWACQVMDQRYEALKAAGVRDIRSYNDLGEDDLRFKLAKKELKLEDLPHALEGEDPAHMPYIVILVDEYADLMMVNKEVEKSIVRLAAKSRACGIHVILTTQRPSADVVTGLIKSNLPCRICFRVVDKNNSRVVLDVSGAENLLGKGDMLFLAPGTSFPTRGQGVWLKDQEIEAIVEHAKGQGKPRYLEEIVKAGAIASANGKGGEDGIGEEWRSDRQFHEAVQAMYRYNKTGADFFRRKCGVGYNRATEFVEWLEDLGFLSPAAGTAPRKILKSWDDWIELLKTQGHNWESGDDLYLNPFQVGDQG